MFELLQTRKYMQTFIYCRNPDAIVPQTVYCRGSQLVRRELPRCLAIAGFLGSLSPFVSLHLPSISLSAGGHCRVPRLTVSLSPFIYHLSVGGHCWVLGLPVSLCLPSYIPIRGWPLPGSWAPCLPLSPFIYPYPWVGIVGFLGAHRLLLSPFIDPYQRVAIAGPLPTS